MLRTQFVLHAITVSSIIDDPQRRYGNDTPAYNSTGHVYYRLDKNWKRQDMLTQEGVLRAIGQAPGSGQSLQPPATHSTWYSYT